MITFGQHDQRTLDQLRRCVDAEDGARAVLCADGHVGYSMPIGGVVGYKNVISPSGVGYDIACGNMAAQTPLRFSDIPMSERERLADEIQSRISFGVGRKNNEPVDDPIIEAIAQSPIPQQRTLTQMAASQLGTVGSGNHYVDLLEDEAGFLWIGVHFGSRGFGHKTAKGFMNIAQGRAFDDGAGDGEMDAPPLLLPLTGQAGQDYVEAMALAGNYAYAGRRAVVQKVLDILGTEMVDSIHNHHNFAWQELHFGEKYFVVRKGATPAFPGQRGFVGGSMGDISVILEGVESEASKNALYSTVHGAGRVMSRTQAAGKQKWTKGAWTCGNYRQCAYTAPISQHQRGKENSLPICPLCGSKLQQGKGYMTRLENGLVNFEEEKGKLANLGVVLRGAGADEAPPVYRKLQSVLDAHSETINILHTLFPRVVVMAGKDEYDPYKD